MFNNFFLAALGQILQRMSDERADYAIALPGHKKFIRLARAVPARVRKALNLYFWFVFPEDDEYKIAVLGPFVT